MKNDKHTTTGMQISARAGLAMRATVDGEDGDALRATGPDLGRLPALLDIVILLLVFWSVWSLRFFGIGHIGFLSMVIGVAVGLVLMARRGVAPRAFGLMRPRRGDLGLTLQAVALIGATFLLVPLLVQLVGPINSGAAIDNQPKDLVGFLIDIVVFTVIGAGIGEELFFRGILLNRFRVLFGVGVFGSVLAVIAQAVVFGMGHIGQSPAGIILISIQGAALGAFFLWRAKGSLFPQMLAHAIFNTSVLTVTFLSSAGS